MFAKYAVEFEERELLLVNIMEKFKLPYPQSAWRAVGGVQKNKPSKFKKKLVNLLKKDRTPIPIATKSKSVSFRDRFADTVIVESSNGTGRSKAVKKKKKMKKIEIESSETSDDHSEISYTSNDTDSEVSVVNIRHSKRKRSSASEQSDESEINTPLVVEMQNSAARTKPPGLLQKFDSDSEDLDAAVKLFYESLMESSIAGDVTYGAEETSMTDQESDTTEIDQWTDVSSIYEEETQEECISVYELPSKSQFIVFMKHPYSIFFKGKLSITVLRGCIEVLGCVMDSRTNARQTIYSPRGSSMMSIETCYTDPPTSEDYEVLSRIFEELELNVSVSREIISDIESRSCVVLLEAPSPKPLENFLKTLIPEMQLFSVSSCDLRISRGRKYSPLYSTEEALKCVFELPDSTRFKHYKKSLEWERTSEMIIRTNRDEPGTRTVICGGKGVGKSTFLRFLVNRTLSVFREVLCLDLDPGQTEFAVPGTLSAVLVKQPLLGPNFTHVATPECMVNVGEVNIAQCPIHYLDSVRYIIDFCNSKPELQKLPWIVNTMGFNKGIGVDLTVSLIRFVNPCHVVQIQSRAKALNFPSHLSTGYVWQYSSRFCNTPSNFLQYSLILMKSSVDGGRESSSSNVWGLAPVRIREAMVLSYLSQMLKAPTSLLTDIVPYKTSYSKLILCVCHASFPHSQILGAINGNLVALCTYNGNDILVSDDPLLPRILRKPAVCPCLGFGIVRGIDPDEKNLFLLTPLSENELSQVNCLMLGAVTLPSYVYTMPQGVTGHIPYVATGPGQPSSKIVGRFFRPLMGMSNKN